LWYIWRYVLYNGNEVASANFELELRVSGGQWRRLVDAGKKLTGAAVKSGSFVQGLDKNQRKKMHEEGALLAQVSDANDDAGA